MMKTLVLVDPTYNPGNIPPNLGLGAIEAQFLNLPVDILVCDFVHFGIADISLTDFMKVELNYLKDIESAAESADVVYISGSHGMDLKPYAMFPRIAAAARVAKNANPDVSIIFGGALATFYLRIHKVSANLFKRFGIDHVVSGQEQQAAGTILNQLDIDPTRYSSKNLLIPSNQLLKEAPPQWKSWDLDKYPSYLSLMIQSGCPHQCSFCFEGKVYDPKAAKALPYDLNVSLSSVRKRHQVSGVMLEDSIALSHPWFPSLANEFDSADISWAIYARASELVKKKDELADVVARGCKSAIVGIESLEDNHLTATNKKTTANENILAIEAAEKANLAVQGCFILGFPEDKISDSIKRVEMAQSFGLSTFRWHILQPDWSNLPKGMMGVDNFSLEDHFNAQVSIPDSCIEESLVSRNPALAYDEHVIIRLISQGCTDMSMLSGFGYEGMFTLADLAEELSPRINQLALPTNEDEMYPYLFEPEKRIPSQQARVL